MYKVLAEIINKPIFDKLNTMFQELRANATAVLCTLGGDANKYLGIIVCVAQCDILSPTTPLVSPPMPGALAKTQYETAL